VPVLHPGGHLPLEQHQVSRRGHQAANEDSDFDQGFNCGCRHFSLPASWRMSEPTPFERRTSNVQRPTSNDEEKKKTDAADERGIREDAVKGLSTSHEHEAKLVRCWTLDVRCSTFI
jgi:hypothetical protein